jgi:nitrite reductase (NADH) small subunit
MSHDLNPLNWVPVCALDDIVPNTGVCALVEGKQVAVFNVAQGEGGVYAIDNYDPCSQAAVLSRGLIGNLGEHRGGFADLQAALRPAHRRVS